MPNSIKNFTERSLRTTFLNEYFSEKLSAAEYGGMVYTPTANAIHIVVKVGRVGLAIGKRGKTIKTISTEVKEMLGTNDVQIEVEAMEDPEESAQVMAARLASSLERGRHFRRTAYGIIRRVMHTGALGCEIIISGKITSQRARVESFRQGYIAKTGSLVEDYVDKGYATAKIKRGLLGVRISIMNGDAVIPDDVNIIAEPTHTSREITTEEDDVMLEDIDGEEGIEETIEEEFGDLEEVEEVDEMEATLDDEIPEEATEALDEDSDLEELEDE